MREVERTEDEREEKERRPAEIMLERALSRAGRTLGSLKLLGLTKIVGLSEAGESFATSSPVVRLCSDADEAGEDGTGLGECLEFDDVDDRLPNHSARRDEETGIVMRPWSTWVRGGARGFAVERGR